MALSVLPDVAFGGSSSRTIAVGQLLGGGGRSSASTINSAANTPRDLTLTVAASGTLMPVLYGRRDVPGKLFARGTIGTDLVVGFIWCIGEIDAIETVYLNDATLPGGVTVTHYTGTPTQGVDATLAAAVPAYADTMRISTPSGYRGVAYSVLRIPTGLGLNGTLQVRAVCRGLKVYDERTATTVYSDNPALCLADLASDTDFGPGLSVAGVTAAANWCDTLLGGAVPRARMALLIAAGRKAPDYFDLMSEYAECYYVYEGAGIRLIPDQAVDLSTVPTVAAADILEGSLSITAESSADAPTEVEIQYTEPASPATEPWGSASVRENLAGVDEGTISRIPTSVSLEGVYRDVEASNKALARLRRMQDRIKVAWQTLDGGVVYQLGDVRKIEHAARGVSIPVRLERVDFVKAGRYQVTASRYDASYYPSELILPPSTGTVPVGAITLLSGSTIPDGWADYTAANGKYIVGAGTTYNPGDTGGTTTVTVSGNTSTNGDHLGNTIFYTHAPTYDASEPSRFTPSNFTTGGHAHTYTTGVITPSPLRRHNRLIIKTGTDGLSVPVQAQVFGLANLVLAEIQRVTTDSGRVIVADTASSNAGAASAQHAITTGTTSNAHVHGYYTTARVTLASGSPAMYQVNSGGGSHAHSVNLTETPNLKRRALALYGGIADYDVIPGMIFAWAGSIASIPTDWVLCDGANGSPDMRDRFVEIAGMGNEGTAAGDNTVTATGTGGNSSHSHKGTGLLSTLDEVAVRHSDTHTHNHTISGSAAWTPPYYALAFIMFAPAS